VLRHSFLNGMHGRRLLSAAAVVWLLMILASGADAQRVIVEPMRPPTVTVTPPVQLTPPGTGPGLGGGVLQQLPTAPTIEAPVVRAAPAAPVVRFRCELAPQDQACRESGSDDGGGGDDECNCARDRCYWDDRGRHVCEKRQ
jgi:hypothetical protein